MPLTVSFELDYAEFLDEALVECWELRESFEKRQGREWWILKPGMSDQGQGIRLFSTEGELREIFEEWEAEMPDSDDENGVGTETPVTVNGAERIGAGTMTSQLRHFVAQKYIETPLLFKKYENRKFHIRSYVLAVGALQVYVYRDMLALFAPLPYAAPGAETEKGIDPLVHLTNTCLESGTPMQGSIHRFWDLPSLDTDGATLGPAKLASTWKSNAFDQIGRATSTLFEAAAREQMIHFQTLSNAFEAFGVDWMVDDTGNVWLLEVNAFPDFRQSGNAMKDLVGGFWEAAMKTAVSGFFGAENFGDPSKADHDLVKVLDIDLGRG